MELRKHTLGNRFLFKLRNYFYNSQTTATKQRTFDANVKTWTSYKVVRSVSPYATVRLPCSDHLRNSTCFHFWGNDVVLWVVRQSRAAPVKLKHRHRLSQLSEFFSRKLRKLNIMNRTDPTTLDQFTVGRYFHQLSLARGERHGGELVPGQH